MTRRKGRPHDPAAAARAHAERRERDAEIARLRAQGATITTDRGGKIISACRSNVFNLLLTRGTITQNQHDAAYRLAQEWATWKGLDGKGERSEAVDCGSGCAELVTDRMIRAGREVNAALQALDLGHVTLLVAFMVATVEEDRPMAWRGIVQRVTGEVVRDKQPVLVVAALEALRAVYEQPRRAAA